LREILVGENDTIYIYCWLCGHGHILDVDYDAISVLDMECEICRSRSHIYFNKDGVYHVVGELRDGYVPPRLAAKAEDSTVEADGECMRGDQARSGF
jgi:hypothetical protein